MHIKWLLDGGQVRCTGVFTGQQLSDAARSVLEGKKSVSAAAKEFNIKRMTLTRYISKLNSGGFPSMGYSKPRLIFSQEQESFLKNYLLQMASIFYGYTPKDVSCLAYECAVQYKIRILE